MTATDSLGMAREPTILIVDGDAAMRATLREQLTRGGAFAVAEAETAQSAWALLEGDRGLAAAIVDADLPDADGHDLCDQIRARGLSLPVILLNGTTRISRAGDTFTLAKPFRLGDLMARLRARLETPPPDQPAASFPIGPYECHPMEKALRDDRANRRIRLTEKETAILAFLHRMGERAVPRLELLREVWGYHPAVTTHTLETHIYRLRRKIEADPANARLLVTEGGGYRLVRAGVA